MSGTDSDCPRSRLASLEDAYPGHQVEIVGGEQVLSGRRPTCGHTVHSLWRTLRSQVPAGWGFISDVAIPVDDANEFCPDLAVIPAAEVAKNLSAYSPELIELAVEVVSPSSVRNDYEVKDRAYARRGIPHYLIFDPYEQHCVTLWNPGPDGYLGRDTIPYGKTITVETGIGTFSVDTSKLPVDPRS
ncbi:Uma2 family endonuclease [Streptomyces sp. NPDC018833]|uniref:Uma2 family endonuclease n=1 Tax=Streptomyces sp. NPDC018833 TaxID=3365053 RepID=UPI003788A94A